MPGSSREPAEEREGPPIPSKDDDAQKQRQSHKQGKENVFRGKESEKKAEKEEPNSPLKQEQSAKGQTTEKGERERIRGRGRETITKKAPALLAAGALRTIFGSGLLSHMTLCSIIGDGELNFRVRNGVGCTLSSMATKEISGIF